MTFPTAAVNTTNVDSSADDPSLSRADLLDAIQKLNQIIANGSPATLAGTQTLSGVNTFSQSPVVPSAVAVDHAVSKGQMDGAILAATPGTATTSVAGTVVLASSAVANIGTDTAKAVTSKALADTILGGIGATVQTFTSPTRQVATNYTNSSGRTISIAVSVTMGSGGYAQIIVDGTAAGYISSVSGGLVQNTLTGIIPAGMTYQVTSNSTINYWIEIR